MPCHDTEIWSYEEIRKTCHCTCDKTKRELQRRKTRTVLNYGSRRKGLDYKKKPYPSTFSKVRERVYPRILKDIYEWIIHNRLKGKRISLFAQNSSDIPGSIQIRQRCDAEA